MQVELPHEFRIVIANRRGDLDETISLADFPPDAIAYLVWRGLRDSIGDGVFTGERDIQAVIKSIKGRRPIT